MKILLLGYRRYLAEILFHLRKSAFLLENRIDVIIAEPVLKRNKQRRSIFRRIRELDYSKLILKKDNFLYRNQHRQIRKQLFPQRNLSFLSSRVNIKSHDYHGLARIPELESYDFMIVASFGEKIPAQVFNLPRRGTLNIHPSLLPDLRGGYPTYVQAYDTNAIAGTTIHQMSESWDQGAIVKQETYQLPPESTNDHIILASARYGAKFLEELHYSSFKVKPSKQDESKASYCRRILRPKQSLYAISATADPAGYIRANFAAHIFPFTWCIHKGNVLYLLSVTKVAGAGIRQSNARIAIVEQKNQFYLKFYDKYFQISRYIYRGKLHCIDETPV